MANSFNITAVAMFGIVAGHICHVLVATPDLNRMPAFLKRHVGVLKIGGS
jgi:hypothetical protein